MGVSESPDMSSFLKERKGILYYKVQEERTHHKQEQMGQKEM
jgi:hypothetical protein